MSVRMKPSFEDLLSIRARITREGVTPTRSATSRYEFGRGAPDPASFPYDELVEATARVMKAEGAEAMTYGEPQGYLGLRELICYKYELFEKFTVDPANILMTNGSGHALGLAFSAVVDLDDWVICESPTFPGAVNHLLRHGAKVLDAPVDREGIVTSAVRERLAALKQQGRRCKVIYTIPNFQNPSGPTMSLQRRKELVSLASEFETMIVEDDAYGELRFEGEPLPSLYELDQSGRVVRTGTLSKILGAGTRLGWLCAPREMIPIVQRFNFGGGVSPFMSRVATYY